MVPIRWSKHANDRAMGHALDRHYIEDIISNSDEITRTGASKLEYMRYQKRKLISVICEDCGEYILIKAIVKTTRK